MNPSVDFNREDLNAEQARALDLALAGKSFFLTGSAGTGKSFCLAYMVHALRKAGRRVVVTASTGIGAVTIGGITIHSFAGFGIGNQTRDELRRTATSKRMRDIWQSVDTILIDEISMVKAEYFEKLALVAQEARQDSSTPLGGVQLIVLGDFFQLPPVVPRMLAASKVAGGHSTSKSVFCFSTREWHDLIQEVVELKHIFRQKDPVFAQCLQRIRWGTPSSEDIRLLTTRLHANIEHSGIKPTFLHSRTEDVDRINQEHLDAIDAPPHTYHTIQGFNSSGVKDQSTDALPPKSRVDRVTAELRKNMPADETVTLKVGAQVMLLANLNFEHQLVNGSRGVVTRFTEAPFAYPVVRFNNVEATIRAHMWKHQFRTGVYAYVAQIPLKLAYAYTIHKSQSQSMDCVQIQLDGSVFEDGQAYTALSRLRTLAGLTLSAFDPACIRANPEVVAFYRALQSRPGGLLQRIMSKMVVPAEAPADHGDDEEDEDDEEEDEDDEPAEDPEEDEVVEVEDEEGDAGDVSPEEPPNL